VEQEQVSLWKGLGWLVIGMALVPTAAVLLHRATRRWRLLIAALSVAVVALTVATFTVARVPDVALALVAGILLLAVLAARWRARTGYGERRGWPPGSLALRTSLDALTQPRFYADRAATPGPIFKMAQFHQPVVCIADLGLAQDLLKRESKKLRPPTLRFGHVSPGHWIEFLHDDRHPRYRQALGDALTATVARAAASATRGTIHAELTTASSASSASIVNPRQLADRMALATLVHAIFGPLAGSEHLDESFRRFDTLARHLRRNRGQWTPGTTDAVEQLVRHLRAPGAPRDAAAVLDAIGERDVALSDDIVSGNLVLLAQVTRSNLRGVLAWVLKELLDHPEVVHELRRAPQTDERLDTLARQVVLETLRLHQSEFLYRSVVSNVLVGQYRIPRGWLLRVCVRECHDDPSLFPEPNLFQPERFDGRTFGPTQFLPFSDGSHSAFGAELVTGIAAAFVAILATRWDARIVRDGPPERDGNRHWNHWSPSTALRISLSPRDASRT
jgi:cytochrome P450